MNTAAALKNRARYACEIVQTIRKVVGPKFPILFRISLITASTAAAP